MKLKVGDRDILLHQARDNPTMSDRGAGTQASGLCRLKRGHLHLRLCNER
ncbi:hypothetical protein FVER14953_21295 [Fusarium verticillioides]|nr:hypothetical protein FVER14953_21295 [Fusarium verticillioides]